MTSSGKGQLLSHISDPLQKDGTSIAVSVSNLFKKINKGDEFEFIFFSKKGHTMNKEKYILLLKYMKNLSKAKKLKVTPPTRTLDVNYTNDDGSTYRISVDGSDNINRMLDRITSIQNKNYIIFKFLMFNMKNINADGMTFILKSKEEGNTVDIEDLNMRVRLSNEKDISDILSGSGSSNRNYDQNILKLLSGNEQKIDLETRKLINDRISYRLKERTSLYIEDDDTHYIRIDLTDTKNTRDVRKISSIYSNYELELEYGIKKQGGNKSEHLNTMYQSSENLLKMAHQSSFIIGNEQSEKDLKYYKQILNVDQKSTSLAGRQAISLEIQHVTELLPNKYAVTDKADGDRYFLVIYEFGVYLISSNLNVKDTGILLDKKYEQYNGTVLDGEFIYIPKERRHVFMVFDCLRNGQTDMRNEISFQKRLNEADKIIDACFVFKGQTGFKYKQPPQMKDGFNLNEITKFYGQELSRFYDTLNKDISFVKEYPLIRRKYFMFVFGAQRWEIFKYSTEYWKRYTSDENVKFPYLLDGLIYHPLEQAYVISAQESKYHEYKWKPPNKNSIDFYIEFKRDPMTGKIMDVYDNSLATEAIDASGSVSGTVRNQVYRICTLYVGKSVSGKEHPVKFDQNYGVSDAYIYVKDGETRDSSGDIISDKTVVEFYYQNDMEMIPQQRWVPIKTRYDKTESVERYERKYGNYQGTAERIWRSIVNPVLMEDFIELARGNTNERSFYDIKIKEMNSKISKELVAAINREKKYYQKITKLAETMRQMHNMIKSNLIYTYFNKMYQSNTQQSVLDIACGRGGDIGKFYYTEVAYYVGIDIDGEGIRSPSDGAISRYEKFRRKKPNFPKMYFIQADARVPLKYDSQIRATNGMDMDDVNKKLLQKFFPTEGNVSVFDRINCQFAMHYFLKDELSWNNFKQNLKTHLRAGGYFVATTFDAHEVMKSIGDKDSFTVYYDDSEGNKKKFFDIIKKYPDPKKGEKIGVGMAIDLYASWMFNEGNYVTEYLVDLDFVKEELEKDSDLELIDTDLFRNQYEIHKTFLTDGARYESSEETRSYLANVAEYYEDTEMNRKCLKYTNLNRYYVFRKKQPSDTNINKKHKGGKGKTVFKEQYDFSDMNKFLIPDMNNYDNEFSFINSVHKLLVSHAIIPKSVSVDNFVKDIGLNVVNDSMVDDDYIKKLVNKTVINHEIVDDETGKTSNQKVIDGLNVIFVERDCNNFYDSTSYLKSNPKKTDRSIVVMREGGGLYKPLLMKCEKGIKGIFKLNDPLIQNLIGNSDHV